MDGRARPALRLWAVIVRDLKKFLRNPVVIAMSFLMPVLYLVIMGSSFQGKLVGLPVAVVDHDGGRHARELIDGLRAIAAGPGTVTLQAAAGEQAALAEVRAGRCKAALVIPPGFSAHLDQGARPQVALLLDNTDGISSRAVTAAVQGAFAQFGDGYVPIRESVQAVQLRDTHLYRSVDYFQSLVPGILVMAIFLGTMTTGVFNVAMDRFLGIEESYLLTPLSKADIVAGLVLSGLGITFVVSLGVLAAGMAITGIPVPADPGTWLVLLLAIVLTTLCLQSLMFALLARADHPRLVGVTSGFLNVILFFPSGAVYPTASLPGWLRAFARVNPEAYAVDVFKALLFKGAAVSAVLGDLAFLAGFLLVAMSAAILLFKRTL